MTPLQQLQRQRYQYGSIYPAWEYELDANMMRTGRKRARQSEVWR
jgi:hypothetical protein